MKVFIITHDCEGCGGSSIEDVFDTRKKAEDLVNGWFAKDHDGKNRADLYIDEREVR